MRNKNAALALIALCLLVVSPALGYWDRKANPGQYGADLGSALCAGVATEEDNTTRNCVWFLENGQQGGSDWFQRYDVGTDAWAFKQNLPNQIDAGGALAFVTDPSACPQNGWVFALRGGNTADFWVFYPNENHWYVLAGNQLVPENVIAGGALCYGGIRDIGGTPHAVLYAFTGQEHYDNGFWYGHFFRYVFELIPYDGPQQGWWERLADIAGRVGEGGALAWVPLPDAQQTPLGLVIGLEGGGDDVIWRYDPVEDEWWGGVNIDPPAQTGACMTPRADGNRVMLLHGGSTANYTFYDASNNTRITQSPTPQTVKGGAGIAQLNDLCYAEFGTHNQGGVQFHVWMGPPEGGQGDVIGAAEMPDVSVRQGRRSHTFAVRAEPGPVSLTIADAAGRVVGTARTECADGTAVLTWDHSASPDGVHLYVVSSTSGTVTGKTLVMR
jgi:hypothetical protein